VSAFGFAAARVVTCDPQRTDGAGPLAAIERGAVVVDGGLLAYVGPREGAPAGVPVEELGECVITPGLVDAHTHAAWAGSRHAEYAARMAGDDYLAIARAGGGIRSTHRAVAEASEEDLASALASRLRRMASLGVTTVEVKSGYGLESVHERKQLAAIARAAARSDVPAVVPTLLALHALPPGEADRTAFAARVARELVPEVGRERLARFVDAYVDVDAFTVEQARVIGDAARTAALGIRLHVGQFADIGGAELAAALGAASADHLEHVSDAGVEALARAHVAAVLLPVASFTLGQAAPPVSRLRDAGVPLVVASDANPGTAPTESLPLAMALAVRMYGLSLDETILGATRHAATSLQLGDRGALRVGARADLVAWDLPHEHAIVQPWGSPRTRFVVVDGRMLVSPPRQV
jgi:imidazolonepropionase